ncbi:MAG: transcriptional regulator, TetR family [Phenylobacterium sp.]|nr:transcriptional regulator, TetR family [Phenylobacterium sp.]
MAKRAPLKGEISGERLLEAAAHLFRERGYLATSVREIALAANMKSGSIYYHYPSKEAMLEAVMNRALLSLTASVTSALQDLPDTAAFDERLKAAVFAHLRTIHKYGDFAVTSRQSLNLLSDTGRKAHMRLRIRYGAIWRDIFETARAKGEIREEIDVVMVEMMLIGALNWTHEWLDPKRRSLEQLSAMYVAAITSGIVANPPVAMAKAARPKSGRRAPG